MPILYFVCVNCSKFSVKVGTQDGAFILYTRVPIKICFILEFCLLLPQRYRMLRDRSKKEGFICINMSDCSCRHVDTRRELQLCEAVESHQLPEQE